MNSENANQQTEPGNETDELGRPVSPDTAAIGTIDGEEAVPIPVSMLTHEQLLWAFRFRLKESKSMRVFGLHAHERIVSLIPGRQKFQPEDGKRCPEDEMQFLRTQASRWFNQAMSHLHANAELAKHISEQFQTLDRHATRCAELEANNKELERLVERLVSEAKKQTPTAGSHALEEENRLLKARVLDLEDRAKKLANH